MQRLSAGVTSSSLVELKELVTARFAEPQKCYGHCDSPARLRVIKEAPLTVCYACDAGYVSRVVSYGVNPVGPDLKALLEQALKGALEVRDDDIRVASRYAWDLGLEPGELGRLFWAAFWTQNYGRSKSTDPRRTALFCCRNCSALFLQPVNGAEIRCEKCRGEPA